MSKVREIVEAEITFVSLVGKGANGKDFLIVKSSEVEPTVTRQVPIIKVDEEKRLVIGVVYEPDTIDSQGEFMSADAIEKAAHKFLADYRNVDTGHTFKAENVQVVESFVAKEDQEIAGVPIKKGTWVMASRVVDDAIWEQVKKGELNGYSMGGTGTRIERPDMEPAAEVEKSSDDEVRGFFDVLKAFFTGKPVKKADEAARPKKPTDFAALVTAQQAAEHMDNARWALHDVMRNILADADITDKAAALGKQIDAYKAFVLSQVSNIGVEKALEQMSEPVEKAGRALSSETIGQLQATAATIQAIIDEAQPSQEGENDLKKEDVTAIVAEALNPINQKLEALEKQEAPAEGNPPAAADPDGGAPGEEDMAEVIKAAMKEALAPLEQRIERVEKSRLPRKSTDDTDPAEPVQKEDAAFDGYFV